MRPAARLILLAMLGALPLLHTVAQQRQPATGMLLVATASIADPEFDATVIVLVHHDDDGTVGVMINRPTSVAPSSAYPDVPALSEYRGRIFYGGPVGVARPVALIRSATSPGDGTIRVLRNVFLSGTLDPLSGIDVERLNEEDLRLYAGHAEWGPGQLAAEIAAGNWELVNGREAQIFSAEPLTLWERVRFAASEEVVWQR